MVMNRINKLILSRKMFVCFAILFTRAHGWSDSLYGVSYQESDPIYFSFCQDEASKELLAGAFPITFIRAEWDEEIKGNLDEERLGDLGVCNTHNATVKRSTTDGVTRIFCDAACSPIKFSTSSPFTRLASQAPTISEEETPSSPSRMLSFEEGTPPNAPQVLGSTKKERVVRHTDGEIMTYFKQTPQRSENPKDSESKPLYKIDSKGSFAYYVGAIRFKLVHQKTEKPYRYPELAPIVEEVANYQILGIRPYWWNGSEEDENAQNDSVTKHNINDMLLIYYANNSQGKLSKEEFLAQMPEYIKTAVESKLTKDSGYADYYMLQLHTNLTLLSYCLDFSKKSVEEIIKEYASGESESDKMLNYLFTQSKEANYKGCHFHMPLPDKAKYLVENWPTIEAYMLRVMIGQQVSLRSVLIDLNQKTPMKQMKKIISLRDCKYYPAEPKRDILNIVDSQPIFEEEEDKEVDA